MDTIVGRLNAEWEWLGSSQAAEIEDWIEHCLAFGDCRRLDDLLDRIRRDPDATMRVLVGRCLEGDQLAGRVVLQAMLGKLVRMAVQDREAEVDVYVGALWLRIRSYPLSARPRRIAANLALDTLKAVRRERAGVRPGMLQAHDDTSPASSLHQPDVTAERVITAAGDLGLIRGDTGAVLRSVYAEGLTGRAAAARHGKSPGAIRVQCSTAVRRLALHAVVLAAVA